MLAFCSPVSEKSLSLRRVPTIVCCLVVSGPKQEAASGGIGGSTREQEGGVGVGGGGGETSPATVREGNPSQKTVSIRGMVGPKHGGLRHVDDPSTRVLEVRMCRLLRSG